MIVGAHFRHTANVGDLMSAPGLYFPELAGALQDYRDPIPSCDAVIFGGGALGNRVGHLAAKTQARIKIAWGLGETRHGRVAARPAPEGLDLFGSRDFGQGGAEWVPCASCMSPLFDVPREIRHEAVFYYNLRRPRPAVDGIPEMHNEVEFAAAVEFLASGSVVVTNSYHGCFWATILGRAVVIVDAYSSKLHQFRHRPAYGEWKALAKDAPRYPDALEEARGANRAFFGKVMDRLAA